MLHERHNLPRGCWCHHTRAACPRRRRLVGTGGWGWRHRQWQWHRVDLRLAMLQDLYTLVNQHRGELIACARAKYMSQNM